MYLPSSPPRPEPTPERASLAVRAATLGVIALALFGVLLFRLWALQVLNSDEYVAQAVQNDVRSIPVPAPRGIVYDRTGKPLVTNAPGMAVQVNPAELPTGDTCGRLGPRKESRCMRRAERTAGVPGAGCKRFERTEACAVLARVAEVLGLRRGKVWRDYATAMRVNPSEPVTIHGAVTRGQIAYMRERRERFRGVRFQETYQRDYPFGALAANVLGYIGRIDAETLEQPQFDDLPQDAVIGRSGVEYVYDADLRGIDGEQRQSFDAAGNPAGPPYQVTAPTAGRNLRLTIDARLQQVAQRAIQHGIQAARADDMFHARTGAIVALDPRSGAIRAMATWPTYDPSIFVPPMKGYDRVLKQRDDPLYDRTVAADFPPGSTFKPITASAAWRAGLIGPGTPLLCSPDYKHPGDTSGTVFNNWTSAYNRSMALPNALETSCDTYFYRIGDTFWSRQNQEFQAEIRRFGFGSQPPIDLLGAGSGLVPDAHWKADQFGASGNAVEAIWLPGDDITMAIGQGYLRVSPLQLAVAYAALANGGRLVTPHVADAVLDGDGTVVKRFRVPDRRNLRLDPNLLSEIRAGLDLASHSPNGTSSSVFGDFSPRVAGKTGTAETPPYDDAWYAAWAPETAPKLVVVALIEDGGHGGVAAAPAARMVFQAWFHPHQRVDTVVGVDRSR